MFSLLFLHFFLYGCNIVMWRKARINYSFIFELAPTKELKYRDVFLICTMSMTAVVGVMFAHLSLVAKGYSYSQVQAIPGLLCLVIFLAEQCIIPNCEMDVVAYYPRYYSFGAGHDLELQLSSLYSYPCYCFCAPSTSYTSQVVIVSLR